MTLRDFIEQEIEAGNVFDVEEFGEKLHSLNFEGEEEIEPEEFKDYLDNDLEMVTVKHYFSRFIYSMWYEIELLRDE
jgi:hypothetical protein